MKTWIIDQAHSEIAFKVKHLVISTVRGTFKDFEGKIEASDDTFTDMSAQFSALVASITTNNANRDGHLLGADFFDQASFPTVSFSSTHIENVSADEFTVVGTLTMRGVAKEVTLTAHKNGIAVGMDGARVVSFDISGSINRQDFGLTWNAAVETGGVVVSDMVTIEIQVEAKES